MGYKRRNVYVPIGKLVDGTDTTRFGALLVDAYKAANWRWGGSGGLPGVTPDILQISDTVRALLAMCVSGENMAASGGLQVSKQVDCFILSVDPKLAECGELERMEEPVA